MASSSSSGPATSYNYVATAHKPTNITHSLVASFTGSDTLNLIVARCTRIEIYALEAQGLTLLHDVPLYCRVATMELWRPSNRTTDRLFISTERYQFCIISYDAARKEIVTDAKGDVADRIGRQAEVGQICVIEPDSRLIGLHLYDGLFKVIPAGADGKLSPESFNIRLEELKVLDIAFLHGMPKPTLALLFEDNKEGRHLKTYEVSTRDKDFVDGPWAQAHVEAGASMLIPIKAGGVLVVGETSITYLSGSDFKSIAMPFTIFRACEPIDNCRYLLGDSVGGLHVLLLDAPDGGPVLGLMLERMGTTSLPTTLSYLTDGIAFVGSSFGDSQLIQLQTAPDEDHEYITELDRWPNIGPICDFVVVDLERHGQGSLVTCSGAGKDGSLRIVRNGIGINEQARIELPGIKGLWSAQGGGTAYLVLSFIAETRVLAKEGEELGEVEVDGFEGERATVCCASLPSGAVVQVTTASVRLINGGDMSLTDEWSPPAGGAISMATVEGALVLLATAGSQLHLLEASADGKWSAIATATMEHEIACVAICSSHLPPGFASDMQTDDATPVPAGSVAIPQIAACGLWTDISIRLLSLPTLSEIHAEPLGVVVIPRSLAFAPFGDKIHLFCALGDGQLMTYTLADGDASAMSDVAASGGFSLADRKTVTIGTKPISLTPFHSHGTLHVFAASDRPTVLHAASGAKLLYSNVNLRDATHMAPFPCDADVPDTLAIASEDSLILGTVDEARKLHVRPVYLREQPRRIAHLEAAHTFAVLSVAIEYRDGEEKERNFVRLLDEATFEKTATFELKDNESACSILTLRVPPAEGQQASGSSSPPNVLLVIGTAFARPEEPEPTAGRLLVFDVSDRTLELVCEHLVKGYACAITRGGGRPRRKTRCTR